jgi:hypothetical protein
MLAERRREKGRENEKKRQRKKKEMIIGEKKRKKERKERLPDSLNVRDLFTETGFWNRPNRNAKLVMVWNIVQLKIHSEIRCLMCALWAR